jgi:hypothetical protein
MKYNTVNIIDVFQYNGIICQCIFMTDEARIQVTTGMDEMYAERSQYQAGEQGEDLCSFFP